MLPIHFHLEDGAESADEERMLSTDEMWMLQVRFQIGCSHRRSSRWRLLRKGRTIGVRQHCLFHNRSAMHKTKKGAHCDPPLKWELRITCASSAPNFRATPLSVPFSCSFSQRESVAMTGGCAFRCKLLGFIFHFSVVLCCGRPIQCAKGGWS